VPSPKNPSTTGTNNEAGNRVAIAHQLGLVRSYATSIAGPAPAAIAATARFGRPLAGVRGYLLAAGMSRGQVDMSGAVSASLSDVLP
jgi:hypothetical protein